MRVVTVQHFGSKEPYTFMVDFTVKPHDVLVADAANDNQLVYALTSDYEVPEQDATKVFGVKPYKKIICKVDNTCYCNGTRASEIPMSPISLMPITYFCGRRWVGVDEDVPQDDVRVLVRLDNEDMVVAVRNKGEWVAAYSGQPFPWNVKEWLNIDLEKKGALR